MGWLVGWNYRKKITIQDGNVDGNLTDFPVLIPISADGEIGGHISDAVNGFDIRFTEDDGETLLDYEREYFTVAVGDATAYFWVKVPSILASGGAEIYIYYNDGDGTVDGEDAENVWADYKMVHHMKDDPDTSHIKDSTGNNNDGTKKGANEPNEVNGKVYKGQDYDGGDDSIEVDDDNTLTFGDGADDSPFSISVLVNIPDTDTVYPVLGKWVGDGGDMEYMVRFLNTARVEFILADDGDTGNGWLKQEKAGVSQTGDHLLTVTYDGSGLSGGMKIYWDGILQGDGGGNSTYTAMKNTGAPVEIGSSHGKTTFFKDILSEVRISSVERAIEWINFKYHNIFEGDNELGWVNEEAAFIAPIMMID